MGIRPVKFAICLMCTIVLIVSLVGCARFRIPQIDPVGRGLFLAQPSSTTILSPFGPPSAQASSLGQYPDGRNLAGQGPAFQHPARPPACPAPAASLGMPTLQPTGALVSQPGNRLQRRRAGTLMTTPSRIVAPVGSEVVVMAAICGEDGYFIKNQPLEWMLSSDSSGQIVQVGGTDRALLNRVVKPSSKKMDGQYAWGRTGLKQQLITRGTDTPVDDLKVLEGQTWLSLSSASEGTSYLTCVAPKNKSWPERKAITRVHWVDANWSIPMPSTATAGTIHPLVVSVNRATDGSGVKDWLVKYQIAGGVAAEFHPSGTQTAEVSTDSAGQAAVQIRQPAGQAAAGQTQVRVDVVRPAMFGEREVVLESGITSVNWSSPALTIKAIGPRTAGINQAFNYRIEVTNPGDQVARAVVVSTGDISDSIEYISSTPKPSQFGNRLEWSIGDVPPGTAAKVIEVQMRALDRGKKQLCFEVASQSDQLKTEACGETTIAVPCIGLKINGPTTGRVGDPVAFNFDVTNQCDQPLENVMVRLRYDAGLEAVGIPNPVEIGPIASIMPGETRNLPPLTFRALQSGQQCFNLEITSAGGDTTRANRCLDIENVSEPKVRLDMESQQVVQRGQQALVRMRVTNVGSLALDNVTVINQFSRSLSPVQVTDVLQQRWIGDDLAFDIGRLEPGQSQVIEVLYDTKNVDGEAFSRANVTTPLGAGDQTGVSIRIEPVGSGGGSDPGSSSEGTIRIPDDPVGQLRVNVTALDRTVAVDNIAIFQISVQNNRSVTDQNVTITLLVPPGVSLLPPDAAQIGLQVAYRSSDGTEYRFEPRREMKAGETLSFNVGLRGVQAGEASLEVQAQSVRTPSAVAGRDTITIVP